MSRFSILTFASTILSITSMASPLPVNEVNSIANAIFRSENSLHHPYGIMIKTDNPRMVCINTINHAWRDFEGGEARTGCNDLQLNNPLGCKVSLPFIQFLGKKYCPPSIDNKGFHNWTNNVFRIYNENIKR
jgi:hypothetical protein